MNKNDLSASLVSIETALKSLDRDVLFHSLQDGVPAETLRSLLGAASLSSICDLETLYFWKNGTSTKGTVTLDDIHIFPGFYMLSIEDAIANYRAFFADPRWKSGWLPIFANGGGDFYVLDTTSPSVGAMRHFRIDESEHPVEFTSLSAMLATLAGAFERSIFFVDANGFLEMNDLAFAELARDLNADVDWWRSE